MERMREWGGRKPLLLPPVINLASESLLVEDIDVTLSAVPSIPVIIKSIEVSTQPVMDRVALSIYIDLNRLILLSHSLSLSLSLSLSVSRLSF